MSRPMRSTVSSVTVPATAACLLAMASRCTTALVEPPMAWSTVMALTKDAVDRTSWGLSWVRASVVASVPVCSAMRSRAADVAGGAGAVQGHHAQGDEQAGHGAGRAHDAARSRLGT